MSVWVFLASEATHAESPSLFPSYSFIGQLSRSYSSLLLRLSSFLPNSVSFSNSFSPLKAVCWLYDLFPSSLVLCAYYILFASSTLSTHDCWPFTLNLICATSLLIPLLSLSVLLRSCLTLHVYYSFLIWTQYLLLHMYCITGSNFVLALCYCLVLAFCKIL